MSEWAWHGIKFGDWLNITSLGVALLGFAGTIWTAWWAGREAKRAVETLQRFRNASRLTELKRALETLRTLNRVRISIDLLLVQYGEVAKIVSEQKDAPSLHHSEQKFLADFLAEIREFESNLEGARSAPETLDFIAVNRRLAVHFDSLSKVFHRLETS